MKNKTLQHGAASKQKDLYLRKLSEKPPKRHGQLTDSSVMTVSKDCPNRKVIFKHKIPADDDQIEEIKRLRHEEPEKESEPQEYIQKIEAELAFLKNEMQNQHLLNQKLSIRLQKIYEKQTVSPKRSIARDPEENQNTDRFQKSEMIPEKRYTTKFGYLNKETDNKILDDQQSVFEKLLFQLNKPNNLGNQHLNKFSGSDNEDFTIWFEDFKILLSTCTLSENDKLNKFKTYLSGEARYAFEGFQKHQINTLEKAGEQMKNVFAIARDSQEWILKLNEIKQSPMESIRVFAYRTNRMVQKAFPNADETTANLLAIDYFLRGLKDDIGQKVRILKPDTIEIAIEKAIITEKTSSISFQNSKKVHDTSETLKKCNIFHNTDTNSAENLKNESQTTRTIETYKNDINNRFKQIHDKLNAMEVKASNMNSILDTIPQKNCKIEEKLNAIMEGQRKLEKVNQDIPNNNKRHFHSNEQRRNFHGTENSRYLHCFHCGRKGHGYQNCYFATEEDKQRLSNKFNLKEQGSYSNPQRTKKP